MGGGWWVVGGMFDVWCLMFDIWCVMCDVWCLAYHRNTTTTTTLTAHSWDCTTNTSTTRYLGTYQLWYNLTTYIVSKWYYCLVIQTTSSIMSTLSLLFLLRSWLIILFTASGAASAGITRNQFAVALWLRQCYGCYGYITGHDPEDWLMISWTAVSNWQLSIVNCQLSIVECRMRSDVPSGHKWIPERTEWTVIICAEAPYHRTCPLTALSRHVK